jgi:hypothetical protein
VEERSIFGKKNLRRYENVLSHVFSCYFSLHADAASHSGVSGALQADWQSWQPWRSSCFKRRDAASTFFYHADIICPRHTRNAAAYEQRGHVEDSFVGQALLEERAESVATALDQNGSNSALGQGTQGGAKRALV